MNITAFRALVIEWCQSDDELSTALSKTKSLTDFLDDVLYRDYEGTGVGAQGEFPLRLARWIGSADDDVHRKSLYLLLGHLIFFGRQQMQAGYLTAFSKNIALWLMALERVNFFDRRAESKLQAALAKTAFTEVTDSFGIGNFLRWNNIAGHGPRYSWNQHISAWDSQAFNREIMQANSDAPREHLVLLEDFVGSGTQMAKAVTLACAQPERYNVLFCPIVICPRGASAARALVTEYPHFSYAPVIELPASAFITEQPLAGEDIHFQSIRQAMLALHGKVSGTPGSWPESTSPFGYKDTGAIFCKFDNCPDNSLPLLHHRSDLGWAPLFPRISRE